MDTSPVQLALSWAVGAAAAPSTPIPTALLSPEVSPQQAARRALQEAAATGWRRAGLQVFCLRGRAESFADLRKERYSACVFRCLVPATRPPPPVRIARDQGRVWCH